MNPIDPSLTSYYFGVKYAHPKPAANLFNRRHESLRNSKLSFFTAASTSMDIFFLKALQYPLVLKALSILVDQYDQYDTDTPEENIIPIEQRLAILHHNFNLLIEIVAALTSHDLALKELSPIKDHSLIPFAKKNQVKDIESGFSSLDVEVESTPSSDCYDQLLAPYFIKDKPQEIPIATYKALLQDFLSKIEVSEERRQGEKLGVELLQIRENCFNIRKKMNFSIIPDSENVPPSLKNEFNKAVFLTRKEDAPNFTPNNTVLVETYAKLKQVREKKILSPSQIYALASLQKSIREAKIFAASQQTLTPKERLNNQRNAVFPLKNRKNEVTAFLKSGELTPTDLLETLLFQIACFFEVDKHFAPTLLSTIHFDQSSFEQVDTHFVPTKTTFSKYGKEGFKEQTRDKKTEQKTHLSWAHHFSDALISTKVERHEEVLGATIFEYTYLCDELIAKKTTYASKSQEEWKREFLKINDIDLCRYDNDSKESRYDDPSKTVKGSIQNAIPGRDLHSRMHDPKPSDPVIPQEELIDATLTTFLCGMFDAHEKNVYITPEGKILFFDNSRSLPHADIIISDGVVIAAYRSSLLSLQGSFIPLTQAQRESILIKIAFWEKKMGEFTDNKNVMTLFQNLLNKKQGKLPLYWLDPSLVIKATKARLERIKKALKKEGEITLQELSFASSPSFKLLLLLHIATQANLSQKPDAANLRQLQTDYLPSAGAKDFKRLIDSCIKKGLNVEKMYESIEEPLEILLTRLLKQEFNGQTTNTLFKTLVLQAQVDLKDSNVTALCETKGRHEIMTTLVETILLNYQFNLYEHKNNYKTFFSSMIAKEEEETELADKERKTAALVTFFTDTQSKYVILPPINPRINTLFTLLYKEGANIKEVSLDILTQPLKILVTKHALDPLSFEQFKGYCDTLPESLRSLHEETLTQVPETLSIEYVKNGETYRSSVVILK